MQETIAYLSSDDALRSIEADPYWPKWNSPWWHMSTLHEMGLTKRIPERAIQKMVATIQKNYIPAFFAKDFPPDKHPAHHAPCHCSLGNIYQILSAYGVDVDHEIPWAREWFLKYQLPDGGLNCDEDAYPHPAHPSSIVGTIAPLEAVLLYTKRDFTSEEADFLDRGAQCLINRQLIRGSHEDERLDEEDWLKLCFPRLYLYDVLRGLTFLLKWSEIRKKPLPRSAIQPVIDHLLARFPDGKVRTERLAYDGIKTYLQDDRGTWHRPKEASLFPLLTEVSKLGQVSPYLSAEWSNARQRLSL